MYSASLGSGDNAILLKFTAGHPPDIIDMKPIRERRSTPSATEESCEMRSSVEMELVNVRHESLVRDKWRRARLACSQWRRVSGSSYDGSNDLQQLRCPGGPYSHNILKSLLRREGNGKLFTSRGRSRRESVEGLEDIGEGDDEQASGHASMVEDVLNILRLREGEGPSRAIPDNGATKE